MNGERKNSKQVKAGIVLSYTLIILNALYGLFLTPFILSSLGDSEYGVYKTITSLTSSLMVLDLGIGSTVMRYVAKYRAKNEDDKIPNFAAMNLLQAALLCVIVAIVSTAIFFSIKPVYSSSFTMAEIQKAQSLFIILALNILVHIIENVFNGIITGSNRFGFGNGVKLIRLALRISFTVILLLFIKNSLVLVLLDLTLTILCVMVEMFYVYNVLHIKVKFSHWDKSIFFESGKYTMLMFLTSIAAQVNNNLDNVIIGAISGPTRVAVYSMGLLIFAMYEHLSTAISGVMLPTVTNILEGENAKAAITKLIVRVGRIQFMLLGAAVVGFACIGKYFINIWLGQGYEDVYIITLILMIPSLFELCVNVCLSILRAKNMLTFRTLTLFASTLMNALITVFAVKYWSYIGAAFGTAASFIIGSLVVMNIYYYKKLKLPMLKIYGQIVNRTWVCLIISGAALFALSRITSTGLVAMIINILFFCIIYGATLILYGFSDKEKEHIPLINKLFVSKQTKGDT